MRGSRRARGGAARALAALPALALAACFGGVPDPPRYFEPASAPPLEAPRGAPPAALLELRPVRAGAHLRDRIVWRRSDVELGYYDQERWTETPPIYVERALSQELFERRGIRRAARGATHVLEVEVLAFEEVLLPEHLVRVSLAAVLRDAEQVARYERTLEAKAPVKEAKADAMARAMGEALSSAVRRLAEALDPLLRQPPPPREGR